MKRIWNTFCEDISKNKGVKEMTFEKEIVKGFLQALGWSRYDRNLEEQYGLYSRKWIPDFVFYLNNDKNAKEIILELKNPDHKQRKVDIEQIEAYMKLTDCRFGLYFGEKLEVFYLQEKDGKRSAASVTTIDWTISMQHGQKVPFDSRSKWWQASCPIRKKWMWKMSLLLLVTAIVTKGAKRSSLCVSLQRLTVLPSNIQP